MSKISREDNKKRFKTGMYPTQQDFENVFDSYVHKDDTIDPSKIVSGNENIVDIINRKAEERHNHPISEVDNLGETLQQIQDDLDTAEDNIAGHETRIVTLEAAKTDYEAFKERVRAFLEDANASDTTIDRWHEIENFLQGITDTETLTGLLNDLKQEILAEIPEPQTGNYLELVDDLDAYTDAPDGKIVKYVGQTNEKYTRGFDYERVAGQETVIPQYSYIIDIPEGLPINAGSYFCEYGSEDEMYRYSTCRWIGNGVEWKGALGDDLEIGDVLFQETEDISVASSPIISKEGSGYYGVTITLADGTVLTTKNNSITNSNSSRCTPMQNLNGDVIYKSSSDFGVIRNGAFIIYGHKNDWHMTSSETTIGTPSTWQPIPSFNVIN